MCMLCGETAAQGREAERNRADALRRLAVYCEKLANGTIKPHSEDAKHIALLARSIVRDLVAEYI